jgi:hypothetical protein
MRGRIFTVLCLVVLVSEAAEAAGAPKALLGKSIVVSWNESRVQKAEAESEGQTVSLSSQLNIYVSSAGRIFTRLVRTRSGYRGRGGRSGMYEREPGGARATGVRAGGTSFSGQTMAMYTVFESGARQILINFDSSFSSCEAKISHGKEGGGAMRQTSLISGRKLEVASITVSGVSCSVKEGNVFGGT